MLAQGRAKKSGGRARLPNPELIRVEIIIGGQRGLHVKTMTQVGKSRGREGGLAPALPGLEKS